MVHKRISNRKIVGISYSFLQHVKCHSNQDDSSNPSLPSYAYFSQPYPTNLNNVYDRDKLKEDCESDGEGADSDGS